MSLSRDKIIIVLLISMIFISTPLIANAIFSKGHETYETTPTPTDFCAKCHPTQTTVVLASEHGSAGCSCHGYNPNSTTLNPDYNINETHDLSTKVYCTSCHSQYDNVTGNITIHSDPTVSGLNQSGHYLMNISSLDALYNHTAQQFK